MKMACMLSARGCIASGDSCTLEAQSFDLLRFAFSQERPDLVWFVGLLDAMVEVRGVSVSVWLGSVLFFSSSFQPHQSSTTVWAPSFLREGEGGL